MTYRDQSDSPESRVAQLLGRSPQAALTLAEALGVQQVELKALLRDAGRLSLSDLVSAADALDVPVSYLSTGHAETDLAVSLRLGRAEGQFGVPALALASGDKLIRRGALLDFWQGQRSSPLEGMGVDRSPLYKEAGRRTAGKVRDALDLGDKPIPDLVALVEECRVPVAFETMPRQIHGVNIREQKGGEVRRAIVVRSDDYWARQRFTLAHELCHALYDDEGQVIVNEIEVPDTLPELRAESFARHLILPVRALKSEVSTGRSKSEEWPHLLARIMLTFGISRTAAIRALVDDGHLPEQEAPGLLAAFRRVEDLMGATGYGDEWALLCENQHEPTGSPWLVARAVEAFSEGLIDVSVVADLLGEEVSVTQRQLSEQGWSPIRETVAD